MERIKELYVVLDNTVGAAGEMARVLRKKHIGVQTIAMFVDSARMCVTRPDLARKVLEEHGYQTEVREVLRLIVPNRMGVLEELTLKLGNAGINIEYLYCSLYERMKKGVIILEVDQPDFAIDLFRNHEW